MALGIDEGGTFTDFVYIPPGGDDIRITKVNSRESDTTAGIFLRGLEQMRLSLAEVDRIVYGTTVGTNATLERAGAKVGLVCTQGFRDVLDHQRWHQRVLYDLHQERPAALVKRRYRCQINERVSGQGEVLLEAEREEIARALEFLRSEGVEAIAVAFMNSYTNGHNEELVGRILSDLGAHYVSLSSEIAPIISEWERTSTTVMNAYTQPIISTHLDHLGEGLSSNGQGITLNVMQSNGGIISREQASRLSVRTMLSGPAGGVIGAKAIANAVGHRNVITIDMGGTSCDVSVITDGKEEVTKEGQIGYNLPVRVPMISIHTIGAGGGSIAFSDKGGSLKVGPRSAGAVPGPACYGRGGTSATVTDAHLLLNHLTERGLLGGRMPIQRGLAETAIGALADKLGLSLERTSSGILSVANNLMVEAIKLMTVDRGIDPRNYTLIAYGGMSPMHACDMAEDLEIETVLIPTSPGVLSAYGLAIADLKTEFIRTVNASVADMSPDFLMSVYRELEDKCRLWTQEQNVSAGIEELIWSADMRYGGQTFEINVPVERADMENGFAQLINRFHHAHEDLYAYSIRDQSPFFVAAQVTVVVRISRFDLPRVKESTAEVQPVEVRKALLNPRDGHSDVRVYERDLLLFGHKIIGPALVEQRDCTVVVPSRWVAKVDEYGNLIATLEK